MGAERPIGYGTRPSLSSPLHKNCLEEEIQAAAERHQSLSDDMKPLLSESEPNGGMLESAEMDDLRDLASLAFNLLLSSVALCHTTSSWSSTFL